MEQFILFLPVGHFQNHKVFWGHLENKENRLYTIAAQTREANPQITENQEGFDFIKSSHWHLAPKDESKSSLNRLEHELNFRIIPQGTRTVSKESVNVHIFPDVLKSKEVTNTFVLTSWKRSRNEEITYQVLHRHFNSNSNHAQCYSSHFTDEQAVASKISCPLNLC